MNRFEPPHSEFDPDRFAAENPAADNAAIREQWLGYILGALEPDERLLVERDLARHPELRTGFDAVARSLGVLGFPDRCDDASREDIPRGLAARTLDFIDAFGEDESTAAPEHRQVNSAAPQTLAEPTVVPARTAGLSARKEPLAAPRRFSWADMAVAASLLVAAIAVLAPALMSMRGTAHTFACQDNLRVLGVGLQRYAEMSPRRSIPEIATEGARATAGVYAVALKEKGLLDHDRLVICPASELAPFAASIEVPTFEELDAADESQLPRMQRVMGGSYGYNLGFVSERDGLKAPMLQSRTHYPLMADAPKMIEGRRSVDNHGRQGTNVLFEDGRVRLVADMRALATGSNQTPAGPWSDDPFVNRSGIVAAGEDADDVVIGESSARAIPLILKPWTK